ncbi:hypothetical protein HK098_000906 [Nowakowskiella sp. JEL0407]|nr:hypothetical protein HK098_000906 [Nowakowskiella sp. JEL0407]
MSYRKTNVDFDDDEFVDVESELRLRFWKMLFALVPLTFVTKFQGNLGNAVVKAIQDPPFGRNVQDLKERNLQMVIETLQSTRSSDIPSIIKTLDAEQLDLLMKFIYNGMAKPEQFNSGVLLGWHEKIVEVAGIGSIVRVLTDRRLV